MLSVQDAVQAICQYMFDQLDFNHFSYRRYYDDGKTINLVNSDADDNGRTYIKALYGEDLYVRTEDLKRMTTRKAITPRLMGFLTPQFGVADGLANAPFYRKQMELASLCNIGNRVGFYQRFKNYIEISAFGSSSYEMGVFLNFCIQNLSVFQNFIQYFRTAAEDLIEMAIKDPIMLSSPSTLKSPQSSVVNFVGHDFKNNRKITLRLTGQEAAILQQLSKGQTFKGAAKNMLISPRTVENHIYSAKMKSKCNSTNELVELFSNLAST
ncbi:helix-turn-helix transcriptional regulator [Candidatus Finniella inopinata]|uniref:LuxR family transcriptional regulator n=1 Tax=Candidatus Finniella inopinata TaxID=1696036 RepID=A0A4Q7DHW4_9PROT|nr:LuxR family transcriptional regulator [Candidatus Finniella inopinata]RZI45940.1 LuxR family transcriptional regulator [Candidatus Finniella inopinata]